MQTLAWYTRVVFLASNVTVFPNRFSNATNISGVWYSIGKYLIFTHTAVTILIASSATDKFGTHDLTRTVDYPNFQGCAAMILILSSSGSS